ncbi:serotransferrin-like [Eleutherodactylus coqui]|uniref:serotransferrin-like n=1 Tax=Eleutherodactylus coqui TaxID=57060 RepID=UPI003462FE13
MVMDIFLLDGVRSEAPRDSYYAVAVIKKNQEISWKQIQEYVYTGRKCCGMSAAELLRQIPKQNRICIIGADFDSKEGGNINQKCTPGYDLSANLCHLYSGWLKILPNIQCASSKKETFHDFPAAFRCVAEKGGVAIVKHNTVFENTDGKNPADWARDLKLEDFELLCPDDSRASVYEFSSCNIEEIPPGLVFTRPEKRNDVIRILSNQQSLYGRNAFQRHISQMFESSRGQDLLFSDDTQCLIKIDQKTTMKDYLGEKLYSAVSRFSQKSDILSKCI